MKNNNLKETNIDLIVDINTIKMKFKDINSLKSGSIIDFKICAGSIAQIKIENQLIGNGHILVEEKNLAIKVVNIY